MDRPHAPCPRQCVRVGEIVFAGRRRQPVRRFTLHLRDSPRFAHARGDLRNIIMLDYCTGTAHAAAPTEGARATPFTPRLETGELPFLVGLSLLRRLKSVTLKGDTIRLVGE
jgi:hypothetical protein